MTSLPHRTDCVIIGAGFAGVATAWALARCRYGSGIILEREPTPGAHASGRNAGLLRLVEGDPVIAALALRSARQIRHLERRSGELIRPTGSLTLAGGRSVQTLERARAVSDQAGITTVVMTAEEARRRFGFLQGMRFEAALWCPADGVVDIHALLMTYLRQAAPTFRLLTGRPADGYLIEDGSVVGVRVGLEEVRAGVVIDATGAWAGSLATGRSALPLQPLRRHLFVSGPLDSVHYAWPYVWLLDGEAYFRPEGKGLLLSPCDETPSPAGEPSTDPAAAEMLAEKLTQHAPGLASLTVRRYWACLRTFAPDRRPIIGPDPVLRGLHHVCALGGFGMTASAAVGELAAALITRGHAEWIDSRSVSPVRFGPPRESLLTLGGIPRS